MFCFSQKWYEPACAHVPRACSKVRFLTPLKLGNDWAGRAQIWHVDIFPSAKGFALVKCVMILRELVQHTQIPKNYLAISRQPLGRSCSGLVRT